MSLSLLTPILMTLFLMAIQGLLLRAACTVAGEREPTYGNALVTALMASTIAGIGSFVFRWTVGLVLWFFSGWLAWVVTACVWLMLTAAIYRPRLRVSTLSALSIAVVHALMSSVATAIVWGIVQYWPF